MEPSQRRPEPCSRRPLTCLALLALVWLTAGCMAGSPAYQAYRAPYRAHPEMHARLQNIRAAAIAPPTIKIYSLSAGDVKELREDWSATGRDNVVKALMEGLRGRSVELKTLPPDRDIQGELDEVQALFRTVSLTIIHRTYSMYSFTTKLENFDYSVGPIDRILQKYRADALILVYGFDEISTGGRKALKVVGAVLPFVGGPSSGDTGLAMAVIDRSGTILWFKIDTNSGGYDLRDPGSTSKFVTAMLSDLPRLGR